MDDPPTVLVQIKAPEALNFSTNESSFPFEEMVEIPAPGSKSTVPLKYPVTKTFPDASTAILLPKSASVPPTDFAQTKLLLASNLAITMSLLPTEVRLATPTPGSKSTVPSKSPIT